MFWIPVMLCPRWMGLAVMPRGYTSPSGSWEISIRSTWKLSCGKSTRSPPSVNWLAWGLVHVMSNLVSFPSRGIRLRPWAGAGGPTSLTLIVMSMADPSHPGVGFPVPSMWMSWPPTSLAWYSLSLSASVGFS